VSRETPPVITRVADGCYLPPGGDFPLAVTDAEDLVLRAFLRRPAMELPDLIDQTGMGHAGRVLARLLKKYDGAFAPAIRMPGGRGKGGYAVLVVDQQRSSIRTATAAAAKGE
jgi:hypothetical protein